MGICKRCGTDDRYKSGGCKECKRIYYQENKKRIKIVKSIYELNNKDKKRARKQKRRAIKQNAPGSFTSKEWYNICELYDFHCLSCNTQFDYEDLTIDHVVPLSRGGSNYIRNLQPLCGHCNSSKYTSHIDYRTTWAIPEEVLLESIKKSGEAGERRVPV